MSVKVLVDRRTGNNYIQINDKKYTNGKRPKFYYGKGTEGKKAAQAAASRIIEEIKSGNFKLRAKADQKTVRALGTEMWAEAGERTQHTVYQYRSVAERVVYPTLGDTQLHDVSYDDVKKLYDSWAQNYAPATAKFHRTVLNMILGEAVRQQIIPVSPGTLMPKARRTKKAASLRDTKKVKALTRVQRDNLLIALDIDAEHDIRFRVFWLFLALTGVRCSEGVAVQWGDIDLEAEKVSIQRAEVREQDTPEDLPKTGLSRDVDLHDDLIVALRELQAAYPNRRDHDWLFFQGMADSTKRLTYDLVQTRMRAVVKNMRFTYRVTAHVLRHTFASELLTENEPITYVSEQLGHASPAITLRVYAHFIPKPNGHKPVNKLVVRAFDAHAGRTQDGDPTAAGSANIRQFKQLAK